MSEVSQKVVDSFGRNLCPVHWWTRPPDSGERLIVLTDYSRQADTRHCLQSCAESCIDGGPECAVKMEMRAVFFPSFGDKSWGENMSLWKGLRGRCAHPAPPPPQPTPPHPPLRAVNQYRRLSLSCVITYNSQYYNILKSYSGGTVPHHGGTTLQCSDGSSTGRFDFYMVDTKAPPILSLHIWT